MKKLFSSFELINYSFWQRVSEATRVSENSLGIFRWIFGFFLLLFYTPYFSWISEVPSGYFYPPFLSLANLFSQFPSRFVLVGLDLLTILFIVGVTLGIRARYCSWLLLACWLFGANFFYSFGKIDHDILVLALLFCLAFSGWGKYYALIPDKPSRFDSPKRSLALMGVFLAFGMFTAGFKKALNWIDFDFSTSGILSWFYPGYYDLGRTFLLAPSVHFAPAWLFEFADYTAVAFELFGFIALLHSRRWWLSWLLAATAFHLGNTLLLNISFHIHFLVYLVFIDFDKLNARFGFKRFSSKLNFLSGIALVLAGAHFFQRLSGQGSTFLYVSSYAVERELNLYVSIGLWLIAIVAIAIQIVMLPSKRRVSS